MEGPNTIFLKGGKQIFTKKKKEKRHFFHNWVEVVSIETTREVQFPSPYPYISVCVFYNTTLTKANS